MRKVFYGWWVVFACFLIAFYVAGTIVYGFTVFFEPIAEEFNWSGRLIFYGTLTLGFGLILLSQTNSLTMFYGAFLLLALGVSASASTVLVTAVANWFRKNVGKALGIMACGFGVSGILIPLIVHLIDLYQWRTALIILGLGMWVLGIPLSFVIRHKPEQYGYLPDGETSIEQVPAFKSQDGKVGFKEVLRNRNFWHLTIAEAIRTMIAMAVITHVMPCLSSLGIPRSRAALIATFIPLLSIIGRLGAGWLGDILDKRHVMAGAYSLAGAGILAFSYAQTTWLIIPFLILFPLSLGAGVLRGSIVREYFGITSFGRIFGLMVGITAVGGIIGPFTAGWTYDTLGSYHPIWLIFAGISIIPVILMLTMEPCNLEHPADLV